MTALLVSDLHLDEARPEKLALFLRLLERARACRELYILGDLFQLWLGDDDLRPPHPEILQGLRGLSEVGVRVRVQRGNHDFLMGRGFCRATGARLLPDEARVELAGVPALLMHGDTLCTLDREYQRFRRFTRIRPLQPLFTAMPLAWRLRKAASIRDQAMTRGRNKAPELMDVTREAVAGAMRRHGVRLLVHGHTHLPAVHRFELDGAPARRIVLGDWFGNENVLVCDEGGQRLLPLGEFL
ncbi:MAG: UDP-2,3-diacylglucosamine diphosphatase [Gammaproteobacteria bacterium]|nr:MAG: UDP-2,3-diacylglucosamine diphosphatase [Gammaproteobacteria bacterium]